MMRKPFVCRTPILVGSKGSTLDRLCDALGIKLGELLEWVPDRKGMALTVSETLAMPGSAVQGASEIRSGVGPAAHGYMNLRNPLSDADIRRALLAALHLDGLLPSRQNAAPTLPIEITSNSSYPVAANLYPTASQSDAPEHSVGPLLLEEFPLRGGYVRADVAVLAPIMLHLYEIKSDRDRLDRLAEQMRLYNELADRVTMVVGWRHVVRVMRQTPHWWEVWLVERTPGDSLLLVPLREGAPNPGLSVSAIASLLSRDEALSFLEDLEAANGLRSKPRDVLYFRIGEVLQSKPELEQSRDLVRLRQRVHSYWCRRLMQSAPTWPLYDG